MGFYNVCCATCGKMFGWFSDNKDQRCLACRGKSEEAEKPREVEVFIDGTDWQWEVGSASDGNNIFPDVESLQEYSRCWDGCGVVKCKLVFVEWAIKEDRTKMFESSSKSYTAKEFEENRDIIRLEAAQKSLDWMEAKVARQKDKVIELKANLRNKEK